MAPWNWGRKASRSTVAVPTTPPKQMINKFEWDEGSPRSPVCTNFNHLTPKQTGYIDRPELVAALEDIFKSHGKLEFGIITRSERWAFWTPRHLKWAELKAYFPDANDDD
ncbi:hypothetical protein LTR67_000942 [Exophiala xenobiotica]